MDLGYVTSYNWRHEVAAIAAEVFLQCHCMAPTQWHTRRGLHCGCGARGTVLLSAPQGKILNLPCDTTDKTLMVAVPVSCSLWRACELSFVQELARSDPWAPWSKVILNAKPKKAVGHEDAHQMVCDWVPRAWDCTPVMHCRCNGWGGTCTRTAAGWRPPRNRLRDVGHGLCECPNPLRSRWNWRSRPPKQAH